MGPGKPVSIRHCAIYTPKSSETLCFFDRGEIGRRRKYADRCEATHMKIRIPPVNESPDDADVHFLDDQINQYNFETTGIIDGRIISFFVRDESGDIIAGLYGWTWGGTCAVRPPVGACGSTKARLWHSLDGGSRARGARAWVHPNRAQYPQLGRKLRSSWSSTAPVAEREAQVRGHVCSWANSSTRAVRA
jgi:hypothetical protein